MKKNLVIFLFFISSVLFAGPVDSLLKIASTHKIDSNFVMLLTGIAGEYEEIGEYDKSISCCLRAKKIADSLHYKFGQQSALNNLGNSYLDRGDVKKALECHLNVLKVREELGFKQGIAYTYLNLGNIYFRIGQDEEALKNYKHSMKILYEVGDTLRAATCLSNMGSIYSNSQNVKEAESYYLKALVIKKRFNDKDGIAEILSNLSVTLMDAKKYKEALDYAFETITIYGDAGNKLGKAISYSNIGDIYDHMGDLNNAIKYQTISMDLAREMGSQYMLQTCYQLLSLAYSKKNDFKNAMLYAELFSTTRDSMMNSENSKLIAEMQTRFETGKKEKEIELLQKDKNIRELEISKQESSIHRQRIIIYAVIGGLLIIIFLASWIWRGYRQKKKIQLGLEKKNIEINLQKKQIEEKNQTITDSIDYAKSIQNAILPPNEKILSHFPESFVLLMPKEIVSSDFYWLNADSSSVKFATIDCAGYGVPGAFMSIMAYSMLENNIIEKKIDQPSLLLDESNKVVREIQEHQSGSSSIKYGMDISMIAFHPKKMELQFAGTNMPLVIVNNNSINLIEADKKSIGSSKENYNNKIVPVQKGDMVYLFTDGFASLSNNSEKNSLSKDLSELLVSISHIDPNEQKQILEKSIKERLGNNEQNDDILVVGIRV